MESSKITSPRPLSTGGPPESDEGESSPKKLGSSSSDSFEPNPVVVGETRGPFHDFFSSQPVLPAMDPKAIGDRLKSIADEMRIMPSRWAEAPDEPVDGLLDQVRQSKPEKDDCELFQDIEGLRGRVAELNEAMPKPSLPRRILGRAWHLQEQLFTGGLLKGEITQTIVGWPTNHQLVAEIANQKLQKMGDLILDSMMKDPIAALNDAKSPENKYQTLQLILGKDPKFYERYEIERLDPNTRAQLIDMMARQPSAENQIRELELVTCLVKSMPEPESSSYYGDYLLRIGHSQDAFNSLMVGLEKALAGEINAQNESHIVAMLSVAKIAYEETKKSTFNFDSDEAEFRRLTKFTKQAEGEIPPIQI